MKLLQTLLDGIAVGSVTRSSPSATRWYGILKFINFAHSDVFALGSWMSYKWAPAVAAMAGLVILGPGSQVPPFWLGAVVLVLTMATCGLVGFTIGALPTVLRGRRVSTCSSRRSASRSSFRTPTQLQFTIKDDLVSFGTRPADARPDERPDRRRSSVRRLAGRGRRA